ncbi:MAG: STAS domain-containing protein [Planctomycetes bacterium]|nr:STAS domain-containing protein [Planctomycetota bacterium]MBU1518868.1 STAS domain-containing protein [Planctomycetota bacterium]MBU2457155.1 STAS domain-containing protein [Planctomycetota bacterium]
MGIQDWSENVILVNIATEPDMCDELKAVTDIIRQRKDCSVVIDFSDADIVTSSSLAQLLRLQKVLDDNNQQFVLCGTSQKTRGIFAVTGLDKVFEFVDDRFVALAGLQLTHK